MSLANTSKSIVLINPQHPFGGRRVYLNGSLTAIAAVLMAMGHAVKTIDLNLDRLTDAVVRAALETAGFIGVSLTGAAYIPWSVKLIAELRRFAPKTPILLGGQVVENLTPSQFSTIYQKQTNIRQIRHNADLAEALAYNEAQIPSAYSVPFQPAYEAMGEERLAEYLRHEMTLVVSQGCKFRCKFCAAAKGRREQFRDFANFESDLRYLTNFAKHHGIG